MTEPPRPVDNLDDDLDDDEPVDELDDDLDDDEPGRAKKSPVRPSDHDRAMAAELRRLLETNRYSYRSFANAIKAADPDEYWTKSRIQRLANASRRFSLTELADMLATLGEDRTRFLAKVGYIQLSDDLRSRVETDVWLSPDDRRAVLAVINDAYQRAGRDDRSS